MTEKKAESVCNYAEPGENVMIVIARDMGKKKGYRKGTITSCETVRITPILFRIIRIGGIAGIREEYIIYDDGYWSKGENIHKLPQYLAASRDDYTPTMQKLKWLSKNFDKIKIKPRVIFDGFTEYVYLGDNTEPVAKIEMGETIGGAEEHQTYQELWSALTASTYSPELAK